MKRQPLVYIITVNWNCYKHTAECLNSLKKLEYKNYKIVIVDNGSRNNEGERLSKQFPSTKIIKNKINKGYVQANNQGIDIALKNKAKYILLLNNDTIVKSDFLKHLVEFAEAKKFQGVLSPKILYYNSDKIWGMGGKLSIFTSIPRMIGQGRPSSQFNTIIEPDYASGCAFFVNKEVIEKVGLLDPRYFAYYEDTDWSYRIRKAGCRIKVLPKSVIWHKVSQSTKQKNIKKIGETQAFLQAKNGLLFGFLNLQGLCKFVYFINQYTTKLILFLIFKCEGNKARLAYVRGLVEGTRYLSSDYP